jgi:hypothetical protein
MVSQITASRCRPDPVSTKNPINTTGRKPAMNSTELKSIFPIPCSAFVHCCSGRRLAGRVIHSVLASRDRRSILVGVATSSVHQWLLARVSATLAGFP